ncbi:MAG: hypothetical protein HRT35_20420 [Algicola sp.]|nr:hypothetical protein [Algicola sp.]
MTTTAVLQAAQKVVDEAKALNETHKNSENGIASKMTAMDTQNKNFMTEANSRYAGALRTVDKTIVATHGMIVSTEINNAYNEGFQLVELIIENGISCYFDDVVTVHNGQGLYITGQSENTCNAISRRFVAYDTGKSINAICANPGSLIVLKYFKFTQQIQSGAKAGPIEHGFIRIPAYALEPGNTNLFADHVTFETYDVVLYTEGYTPNFTVANFNYCHLEKISNPGWMAQDNAGWIGTGTWFGGAKLAMSQTYCTQTEDTNTEKVCGFMECWSAGGGVDITATTIARTNTKDDFIGSI